MLEFESIQRLSKDLKDAAKILSVDEARFLVDTYYIIQEDRKRSASQVRTLGENAEPHSMLQWFATQSKMLENQIKKALDAYSASSPVGLWARSQDGIGPVLAAGLLAHIDIEKANTAGKLWRFAGLDPTSKWNKGQKRPWNADLKVLCWKIGESFVKVSGKEEAYYGQVYLRRKAYEQMRNDKGELAEQAENILKTKNIGKTTEAYKHYSIGKLPPAHIYARAKRYTVKLFLSHYHEVAYREHFGKAPPLPYAIAHLHHADYLPPPGLT